MESAVFRNPLYGAALIVGISYCFSDAVAASGAWRLVWKGASIGLLAMWAATQARSADGRLFAARRQQRGFIDDIG